MRLARTLDARGVAYAIGGALAFGYWGMPRGTLDVASPSPCRRRVDLSGVPLMIRDAETLVIFKLMFFRDKDLVDIAQILRTQAGRLDSDWITTRLVDLFGRRDPRVSRWHELLSAAHLNHPPGSSA